MIEVTVAQLTFRQGWRWLNWLYGQPQLLPILNPRDHEAFTHVVDDLGIQNYLVAQAEKLSVIGNFIYRMWGSETTPWMEGERYLSNPATSLFFRSLLDQRGDRTANHAERVEISGLTHIETALQRGCGVILLTYHSTPIGIAKQIISRHLGYDTIWTVSEYIAKGWYEQAHGEGMAAKLSLNGYLAHLTTRASQILRKGQPLDIANDHGYDEVGTIPFVIGKRNYQLKTGFAELALATEATVIPYYSRFHTDGRIEIVCQPPLETETGPLRAGAVHREAVSCMVENYARMVEIGLRTRTESLTYGALLKYLRQPLLSSG